MSRYLLISLLFLASSSFANMASPYEEGTTNGTPFTHQHVDILKENLKVTLDKKFKAAFYEISYFIDVKKEGIRVPLLFVAQEFSREFKIWVDSIPVELLPTEEKFATAPAEGYEYFQEAEDGLSIYWNAHSSQTIALDNLKYFEVDLSVGKHEIRVEYYGNSWANRKDWVRKYSFRYLLSPAKYWKSFGELNLTLDATKFEGALTTNLEAPKEGTLDGIATWHFDELPAEIFELHYEPTISDYAAFLIRLTPFYLALIFGILFALLHALLIWWYRKRSAARFSWVAILGSFLVVGLFCFIWIYSYGYIDGLIGKEASHYHGYVEVGVVFLAPFIGLGYLVIALLLDWWLKRSL